MGVYLREIFWKKILRFKSLRDAVNFGRSFVLEYLIPKYGQEEAKNFPMTKTGPWRDFDTSFSEAIGAKRPDPNQETWLTVPEERFEDVEEFLKNH